MLESINPTQTSEWQTLSDHFDQMKTIHMKELFAQNPQRFEQFSVQFNDILIDYSKNLITEETLDKLLLWLKRVKLLRAYKTCSGAMPSMLQKVELFCIRL